MITIRIETELGNILLELDDAHAPRTVQHFMEYVDSGYYSGAAFYRSARSADNEAGRDIRIDVIEAGFCNEYYGRALRGELANDLFDDQLTHVGTRPQITVELTSETGLSHVDGAISLGRGAPDSVDDAFFICVGDQPELDAGGGRHPNGLGFPAFGRVVCGLEVVGAIHARPTSGQKLVDEVKIIRITRV